MRCHPTQQLCAILMISLLVLQPACNNPVDSSNSDSSSKDTIAPTVTVPAPLCYAFVSATDTVHLKLLVQADQSVSGELQYQLGEKDSNHGTIMGTMKGDTILADYKFMSEGTESTRQVVFLKTDSIVTEGYGQVEEVNGKMQFTKGTSQDFSKGLKLFLTNCKKLILRIRRSM